MTSTSNILVHSTVRATLDALCRNAGNDPRTWSAAERDDLLTLCIMMNIDTLVTADHVRLADLQRTYAPHSVN